MTNALLGGLLGAAFVTILVLQLNRQIPLAWSTAAPLYGRLALFYTPHLTVAFYAMLIIREALARRPLAPGWLSIRILSWVGLIVVAAAAALMWANFAGYELALDDDSRRRLGAAAGATTLCAVLLLVIAVVHYSFGRRGSRVGATLLTLTLLASIGFPLTARGWGDPRPLAARAIDLSPLAGAELDGGHVTLLAVDGASLDYIAQRVADGRLPAFGRLLEGGVSLYLETVRPTQPVPVWTAVAAGKLPPQTGVRAAARYEYGPAAGAIELLPAYCFSQALVHFGLLQASGYHATAVRARPLWSILSSQRVSAGIVGWPVTAPAAPLRGFLITDEFEPGAAMVAAGAPTALGAPAEAVLRAKAVAAGPFAIRAGSIEEPPIARDAWRREVAVQLRDEYRPRLLAVRYEGIDRAGHAYLRHALPRAFGGTAQDGEARLATILDRHYAFLDAEIAHVVDTMGPDDVLFVVSGFGMEPAALRKRILARMLGQPEVSGSHEDAPDGFLLAYGAPMRSGRARLGSIVDVAPTILYLLGLPVARDMDGLARTDLFKPAFTATRPIAFIPTYER
ncbi:MAG: alkaline phosphatase family protein [Vicinamibacteraceae bacterium]